VVGSIGAIFGGLGFHEFINKYGIGRLWGHCWGCFHKFDLIWPILTSTRQIITWPFIGFRIVSSQPWKLQRGEFLQRARRNWSWTLYRLWKKQARFIKLSVNQSVDPLLFIIDGPKPGPTSQDAETPSHSGFHPPHLLYNRRGLTRNNSGVSASWDVGPGQHRTFILWNYLIAPESPGIDEALIINWDLFF
jgi:hypothetical protein